jgi:dolichyl-phosphate beta-glucosyltransferase
VGRPDVSLVIACYNGGQDLSATLEQLERFLAGRPYGHEVIVVDDGSIDGSAAVLASAARDTVTLKVVTNDRNMGKGFSIKRGMLEASGRFVFYTDADLAYPLESLDSFLEPLRAERADLVVGSRVQPESFVQVQPRHFRYIYRRHLMSRSFNWLVRALFGIRVMDTQCGLKGFTRAAAQAIFPRVTVRGFTFDVEVLLIAHRLGYRILERPVLCIYRGGASSVKIWRHATRALVDVADMALRDRRGFYG